MNQRMIPITVGGWSFDELLTTSEVARAFRVYPKTITRWANAGKLTTIYTPGGQRRYSAEQVAALKSGVVALPEWRADLADRGHTVTVETITTGRHIVERTDGRLGPTRTASDPTQIEAEARAYAEVYGAAYVPAGGAE